MHTMGLACAWAIVAQVQIWRAQDAARKPWVERKGFLRTV